MSRPNSISDLPEYERGEVSLVTVSAEILDLCPAAAAKIYSAFSLVLEQEEDFVTSVKSGNLVRTKTAFELNNALNHHRRMWDEGKADYEKFQDSQTYPKYDYSLKMYCSREGLEVPQRPEEP